MRGGGWGGRKQQNGARHWAKKHTDGDRSRDRERRCRRRERELRRWERRRERQIERTGWEVLYPSSPSSKTLISSIDSQFFRSLAVKCSSHTHIWTHTHRGWCTHVQPSLPTHTLTHTPDYYGWTGYEVPHWGFNSRNSKVCIFNCSLCRRTPNKTCQKKPEF